MVLGAIFRGLGNSFNQLIKRKLPQEAIFTRKGEIGSITQLESIVKVYAVLASPSFSLPWQNKAHREVIGSGFLLKRLNKPNQRPYIVTNAHVVADSKWVQVRQHGRPMKFDAIVRAAGHECDLALLEVEDQEFWEAMGESAIELGEMPELQDEVIVAGYPSGGDNICVTQGVVSRIEPQHYSHASSQLLAMQIDAAINPGNSGGPVLQEGRCVGVAFQNNPSGENVGFVVPTPIIRHFLEDVELHDVHLGFCRLGVFVQSLESASLRSFLKMKARDTGVLVNRIEPISPAATKLQVNDVVVAIDGHQIANDGTILLRGRERVSFSYLVSGKHVKDVCKVNILRDGELLSFDLEMFSVPNIVPHHSFDKEPDYFIFGGIVFCVLTLPYLQEWGEDWLDRAPRHLVDLSFSKWVERDGQQVIVVAQVLPDQCNMGFRDLRNLQVVEIDGKPVWNLEELIRFVDAARIQKNGTIQFTVEDRRTIVLDISAADAHHHCILEANRIPADRSTRYLSLSK